MQIDYYYEVRWANVFGTCFRPGSLNCNSQVMMMRRVDK